MLLRRKPKSDAEYVEMVRKGLELSKWVVALRVLLSSSIAVAATLMALAVTRESKRWIDSDLASGVLLGACVGVLAAFAFYAVLRSVLLLGSLLEGQRTERLLVKYYDLAMRGKLEADARG